MIFTIENECSLKTVYELCPSEFQAIFGSKNGFQGQNNVQNGSKQSDDVPRVFVKCVGVYNSDGSVGGVYYFFLLVSML